MDGICRDNDRVVRMSDMKYNNMVSLVRVMQSRKLRAVVDLNCASAECKSKRHDADVSCRTTCPS